MGVGLHTVVLLSVLAAEGAFLSCLPVVDHMEVDCQAEALGLASVDLVQGQGGHPEEAWGVVDQEAVDLEAVDLGAFEEVGLDSWGGVDLDSLGEAVLGGHDSCEVPQADHEVGLDSLEEAVLDSLEEVRLGSFEEAVLGSLEEADLDSEEVAGHDSCLAHQEVHQEVHREAHQEGLERVHRS